MAANSQRQQRQAVPMVAPQAVAAGGSRSSDRRRHIQAPSGAGGEHAAEASLVAGPAVTAVSSNSSHQRQGSVTEDLVLRLDRRSSVTRRQQEFREDQLLRRRRMRSLPSLRRMRRRPRSRRLLLTLAAAAAPLPPSVCAAVPGEGACRPPASPLDAAWSVSTTQLHRTSRTRTGSASMTWMAQEAKKNGETFTREEATEMST